MQKIKLHTSKNAAFLMYSNQFEHHIYTIHLFIRNFAKQIYSKNNAQTQNNRNAASVSRRVSRGE